MLKFSLILKFFLAFIFSISAAFFTFEYFKQFTDPQSKNLWWQCPENPNVASYAHYYFDTPQAQYVGQESYFEVHGPAPWEASPERNFNIKSSLYGFFTKYPVNSYPPKKLNEFRIILVGGSGAQGNGGTSNEEMFYSILENKLTAKFNNKIKVSVINLASPGKCILSNRVSLLYLGHALEPDMILMYNGSNDVDQTQLYIDEISSKYSSQYIDAPYDYPNKMLKKISQMFPFIFHMHGFGRRLKKAFYEKYYREKGQRAYCQQRGLNYPLDPTKIYELITYPNILFAIKAIKRDFCGIPIVFALQTLDPGQVPKFEEKMNGTPYEDLLHSLNRDLKNYYNDKWYFLNVHKIANDTYNKKYSNEKTSIGGVHLSDLGHKIVADVLAEHLFPIISNQMEEKKFLSEDMAVLRK